MYIDLLSDILEQSGHHISDIGPAEWAEKYMKVTSGKFQGPLSYDLTPYSRDIIECFSPYHYANEIVLMGAAQGGKTRSIIEPAIAYYISEHPCDIGYLTGHSDLSDESMEKLDTAIDNSGLRPLIRATTLRKKNARTGDTAKKKEFPFGSLVSGSATNHKLLRQRSWRVIIADDIEAAKGSSKESGSTVSLIRARAKSFGKSKKIFWCSTPEIKATSIIEPLFESGDQRLWHWPCPHCGEMIVLKWEIDVDGGKAGMFWKTDPVNGKLIPESVGYICQSCGGFFDESVKYELNLAGQWIATAEAQNQTTVSFHLPGFYAPPGMNNWEDMVREFIEANPPGQPANEEKMKTLVNLSWGETFVPSGESPKATSIMKNKQAYEIGTVPEALSLQHGNGRIVLVTCGIDMNGTVAGVNNMLEHDARIDYEIVAHSESGATYSIKHGSIGTFIPRENTLKHKTDRLKWTYEHNMPHSVWPELDKILAAELPVDSPDRPRRMKIAYSGLDCGAYSTLAYAYLDKTNNKIIAIKGDKEDKYMHSGQDMARFKPANERPGMYILKVGLYKDYLSSFMALKWDGSDDQPANFMNFPQSSGGLYEYSNYFEHFEAEHRIVVLDKHGSSLYRWVKKNSAAQNHLFDCRIYNMAIRDIIVFLIGRELKQKSFTWPDYVAAVSTVK
jgi:phage terminase large subunit GpA-like protein